MTRPLPAERPARLLGPAILAALVLTGAAAPASADPTPPVITPSVSGPLGANGWRIGDTKVTWTAVDPESGVSDTKGCDVRTVRGETSGTAITCEATNGEGLTGSYTVTIRIDRTPPRVRPRPARPPDANGWFNHPIAFDANGSDAVSGIASCTPIAEYAGPDRRRVKVVARCRDHAGHRASGKRKFRYDATAPAIRAAPARPPDRYGWYSRAVRIAFKGSDRLSGLDGCKGALYRGPSSAHAAVTGRCRDRAGNEATRTHRFRFAHPLLRPRAGARVGEPPVLDWVDVPKAAGYNVQLWRDGRKILSRWPNVSRFPLERTWRFGGERRRLVRGKDHVWYVWPRFDRGYGAVLGKSRFRFAPEGAAE